MDTTTNELNNFLQEKRKSKRRSSIANSDVFKIISKKTIVFILIV